MVISQLKRGWIKDILIIVIGVAIIWMGLRVVFGTENPFYVVSSGSMVPELQVYDVLVIQGNIPFQQIDVGDIIVFNRPADHDRVIVHRVVAIIDEDPRTIRTKGDANPASIPGTDFPITEEEYIGEVYTVIPQVGYVTRILTPPINYVIIAIIIGIMIIKQVAKSKKEKEIASTFDFKSSNENSMNENPVSFGELDKIPQDKEYVETEKKPPELDNTQNVKDTDTSNIDSDEKKTPE